MSEIRYVYVTPIHNDDVEARQAQGWEIVDPHPTQPEYTIMTKPVED